MRLFVSDSRYKMISRGRERPIRGVRMEKSGPLERVQLANQVQGFRIPDRSDAWEEKKNKTRLSKLVVYRDSQNVHKNEICGC